MRIRRASSRSLSRKTGRGRRHRHMLVHDLPAAVLLSLEHVGEAGAHRRPGSSGSYGESLDPGTDEGIATDQLNVPVYDLVVRWLHAHEGLRPATLHLAVGAGVR